MENNANGGGGIVNKGGDFDVLGEFAKVTEADARGEQSGMPEKFVSMTETIGEQGGAPEEFTKAIEVDAGAGDDTKKALGQAAAASYAVDLTGQEIDKTTFKELKNGIDKFKMEDAAGGKDVDLNKMAEWRDELMTSSLDKSFSRKFGGVAVSAAGGVGVMDFEQLIGQDDGKSAEQELAGEFDGKSAEQELVEGFNQSEIGKAV